MLTGEIRDANEGTVGFGSRSLAEQTGEVGWEWGAVAAGATLAGSSGAARSVDRQIVLSE